jgi:hypothetical protein
MHAEARSRGDVRAGERGSAPPSEPPAKSLRAGFELSGSAPPRLRVSPQ